MKFKPAPTIQPNFVYPLVTILTGFHCRNMVFVKPFSDQACFLFPVIGVIIIILVENVCFHVTELFQ